MGLKQRALQRAQRNRKEATASRMRAVRSGLEARELWQWLMIHEGWCDPDGAEVVRRQHAREDDHAGICRAYADRYDARSRRWERIARWLP